MQVGLATEEDIRGWLRLAIDMEKIFGCPLADDPGFNKALRKNIARGTAFCIREGDGGPGTELMGGLLFSPTHRPVYQIGWLGVYARWRRQGVGETLVRHLFGLMVTPSELMVKTFAAGTPGGEPARRFYIRLGFVPQEMIDGEGPNGSAVQVFRLFLS